MEQRGVTTGLQRRHWVLTKLALAWAFGIGSAFAAPYGRGSAQTDHPLSCKVYPQRRENASLWGVAEVSQVFQGGYLMTCSNCACGGVI